MSRKTCLFEVLTLAPALLYRTVSGGFSGPASRSGVPLEQPPHQLLPALAAGRVERHSLPRMYRFAELLIVDG